MVGADTRVSVAGRPIMAVLLALVLSSSPLAAAQAASLAKITVRTPGELLLGKVQNADVTISVARATPLLEVAVRSEGAGLSLRSKRKWTFKHLTAGSKKRFKVPYQLAKSFKKGSVQFEIFTVASKSGPNRAPAQKQIATLTLSR
jgi:hypothetical protein